MKETIANAFSFFVPETDFGKFWSIVLIIFFIILLAFTLEIYTGYLYQQRVQHQIEVLNDFSNINPNDLPNKELKKKYRSLSEKFKNKKYGWEQIEKIVVSEFRSPSEAPNFWKFFSASAFYFLFSFIYVFTNNEDKFNTILGGIMLGVIFGVIGLFIPILWSIWVNILLYPILTIILVMAIGNS